MELSIFHEGCGFLSYTLWKGDASIEMLEFIWPAADSDYNCSFSTFFSRKRIVVEFLWKSYDRIIGSYIPRVTCNCHAMYAKWRMHVSRCHLVHYIDERSLFFSQRGRCPKTWTNGMITSPFITIIIYSFGT